jgi:hypothetical protein
MSAVTVFNSSHKSIAHNPHPEYGYDDARETVPVGYVDFDEIDRRLAGNADAPDDHDDHDDDRATAADALGELFRWCGEGKTARVVALRFLAVLAGCRPDLLGQKTYKDIAREFRVTKQNFSKTMMRAEARFKVKFARTRSESGRQRMAAARRGGPARNRG